MAKKETVLVRFVLSPTGKFGLAYSVGDQAEFSSEQAKELIESGYAVSVDETAAEKAAAEK